MSVDDEQTLTEDDVLSKLIKTHIQVRNKSQIKISGVNSEPTRDGLFFSSVNLLNKMSVLFFKHRFLIRSF